MSKHINYKGLSIHPITNWYGEIKKFGTAVILKNSAGEETQQISFPEYFATEREAFEYSAKKGLALIKKFMLGQLELEFCPPFNPLPEGKTLP